jgi:choline dehydrogenase
MDIAWGRGAAEKPRPHRLDRSQSGRPGTHPGKFVVSPRRPEGRDSLRATVPGEIGNSAALRPFTKREAMPGPLTGAELEHFIRDAASTYWHQSGTAKMGQDAMSVVDGTLKVYGTDRLRVADGSTMPRVTTGNTMAPCVIIGERAAHNLKAQHTL